MDDLFPPFAPDADEPKPRRFKPVPFRMIAPNMITLMALCLGLTAIRLAFEGKFEPAVIAIVAAAFLDGIDGRVARMLKGTSRFGAELDSLADFVNFGCAPALILYGFALNDLRSVGWIVALIFAIAMALRLARFNAMLDDPKPAGLEEGLLRRHAGARGRAHRDAAALPALPRAADGALGRPRGARLHALHRAPRRLHGADLLGQDHGQARAARPRAADLPRGGGRPSACSSASRSRPWWR